MRCGLEISLDDPTEIASWYSRQLLLCGDDKVITLENELREIDELTVDAVHRVARQTFRKDRTYGVMIGPVNWLNVRKLRRAVESIAEDLA
jgi:predicted Zn-dependent peptidase